MQIFMELSPRNSKTRGIYAQLPLFCTVLCDGHSRFAHIFTISPICSAAWKRITPHSCKVALNGGNNDLYIFAQNVRTSNTQSMHKQQIVRRFSISGTLQNVPLSLVHRDYCEHLVDESLKIISWN